MRCSLLSMILMMALNAQGILLYGQERANPNLEPAQTKRVRPSAQNNTDLTKQAPSLISIVSRKVHRTENGTSYFDITIPLKNGSGSECRYDFDLLNADLVIILTFNAPVRASDGVLDSTEISVTQGTLNKAALADKVMQLDISVPRDPACVTVMLSGIVDQLTGELSLQGAREFSVVVLPGDVDANGFVDEADVRLIQAQYGQPVNER